MKLTEAWSKANGVTSLADIAAKKPRMRLALNERANLQSTLGGSEAIFGAYGFSSASVEDWGGRLIRGNSAVGLAALQDGKADVFINARFLPDAKVREIARHRPLRWLDADRDSMEVHPGKMYFATFTAKNLSADEATVQAVPSVAPIAANEYFRKIECFCFERQDFVASEARPLPLQFIVDPDLPDYVDTITLSYTLFDIGNNYVTRTR